MDELVENAIHHHDGEAPTVTLSLTQTDDGCVCTIQDDGPGIPALERDALAVPLEEKLVHSGGIGLWIAQTLVLESGGTFEIDSREPTGTAVRMGL